MYYFLGEFGYVFRQLLPFLEQKAEPGITILTWDSVCEIVELLWPNKFNLIPSNSYGIDFGNSPRECTHLKSVPITIKLEKSGFKHIRSLDPNNEYFSEYGWVVYHPLNKKLVFGDQHKEKKYVSVFPRNRKTAKEKNNINHLHIFWLKQNYPGHKIIGHGVPEERINLGIDYVNDTYEKINIFNNSEFLLTPPSGLADFALACGCNIILTGNYPNLDKTNPHGCYIKMWEKSL